MGVTVTFLRMEPVPPADPRRPRCRRMPSLVRLRACTVPFYRYLYQTVGGPYVWWLRRTLPDRRWARSCATPRCRSRCCIAVGEPAGFFELDSRNRPVVNLSYFGLMPHAVGQRDGQRRSCRRHRGGAGAGARAVTVNTCTADHRRALPGYLRAGFKPVRSVREVWEVPNRLGMSIPEHLRV